jgi:hypothetical protein
MTIIDAVENIYKSFGNKIPLNIINEVGEILRSWVFRGEGLGCYQNFDVNSSLKRFLPQSRELALFFPEHLLLKEDEKKEYIKKLVWYKDSETEIEVSWFWDGDGSIMIHVPSIGFFVNDDCKKTHCWYFIPKKKTK